jgi:protein SCO1/2
MRPSAPLAATAAAAALGSVSVSVSVLVLALALAPAAAAQPGQPSPFQRIGFDQKIGGQVPGGLVFRDETGKAVRLGGYFGRRPLVLALVYYKCPMLCTLTLQGLTRTLKGMSFDAGREFEVVVVSFDPRETPAMAAAARRDALGRYGRPGTEQGWHFLTGAAPEIERLTRAAGFRYFWDQESRQYAHPAGIAVLTSEGKLARYFFGIDFASRDVRLALVEATGNRLGSVVDQVLLYCFHYNPSQGRYSAAALNIVRLCAAAFALGLAGAIVALRRREHAGPPGPVRAA